MAGCYRHDIVANLQCQNCGKFALCVSRHLAWARGVEVQRAQKVPIELTKTSKELYAVRKHEHKNSKPERAKVNKRETIANCKYCGNSHESRRCLHTAIDAQDTKMQNTSKRCEEAKACRPPEMTKEGELFMIQPSQ